MSRILAPHSGTFLRNQPTGVPLFFGTRTPRVVTANPWAFFLHESRVLDRVEQRKVNAFVGQARDFFLAAENPRTGSKPLLYYYCFMNLAKAALVLWGQALPPKVSHGIQDPKANIKDRLHVKGQKIQFTGSSRNKDTIWPEFWKCLGGAGDHRAVKFVDVLRQVPSVHRTFTKATSTATSLLPVKSIYALNGGGEVWLRLVFERHDRDVDLVLPRLRKRESFCQFLHQVGPPKDASNGGEYFWFESKPIAGTRRGIDTALRALSNEAFQIPSSAILTGSGYRTYFVDVNDDDWLHPVAAIYAAMFYLGSVVRYKPDVFEKLLEGVFSWVVEEFIASAPTQFIYLLASAVAGHEVVKSQAIRE